MIIGIGFVTRSIAFTKCGTQIPHYEGSAWRIAFCCWSADPCPYVCWELLGYLRLASSRFQPLGGFYLQIGVECYGHYPTMVVLVCEFCTWHAGHLGAHTDKSSACAFQWGPPFVACDQFIQPVPICGVVKLCFRQKYPVYACGGNTSCRICLCSGPGHKEFQALLVPWGVYDACLVDSLWVLRLVICVCGGIVMQGSRRILEYVLLVSPVSVTVAQSICLGAVLSARWNTEPASTWFQTESAWIVNMLPYRLFQS